MHENLNELERALRTLPPKAARIDSAGILFRAGQVSAARRARRWQVATAFFALAAVGVGLAWMLQPAPAPQVRIVQVIAPPPEAPTPQPPEKAPQPNEAVATRPADDSPPSLNAPYYTLQRHMLRFGMDGLPNLPPPGPVSRVTPLSADYSGALARLKELSRFPFRPGAK